MKTTGAVDVPITLRSLADYGYLTVRFTYDPADPYAVTVVFPARFCHTGEDTSWWFARDLLAEVLRQCDTTVVGWSDVRLWRRPGGERITIALSSNVGESTFDVPRDRLMFFLRRTYGLVPPRTEHKHLDLDAGLAKLLAGR